MNINELWQRELAEEGERYKQYQREIEKANQEIRKLTQESEFYVSAYELLTKGMSYSGIKSDNSALIKSKEEKIAACRQKIAENEKKLTGETEQDTRLFRAMATVNVEAIKKLADEGMTRAMYYYACHMASKGNLQISRFKECLDKKEKPYDAKAEMVILTYDVESVEKEFGTLQNSIEGSLNARVGSDRELQKALIRRNQEYLKRLKALQRDSVENTKKMQAFVKEKLSAATDSWNDKDFLNKSTEVEERIGTLKRRLEESIFKLCLQRRRNWSSQYPVLAKLRLLIIPVVLLLGVMGFEACVSHSYDGARLYVELDKEPKLVFQYETEEEKNKADIPEKILFFETETTTENLFQNKR